MALRHALNFSINLVGCPNVSVISGLIISIPVKLVGCPCIPTSCGPNKPGWLSQYPKLVGCPNIQIPLKGERTCVHIYVNSDIDSFSDL